MRHPLLRPALGLPRFFGTVGYFATLARGDSLVIGASKKRLIDLFSQAYPEALCQIKISEFRANCLALIDQVHPGGEPNSKTHRPMF
jgi:hypothetical protein